MKICIGLKSESINYQDLYGKGFQQFFAQYKKSKNKNLYVNFSNFVNDVDNKNAHSNPDHNDPVAVYGYPLEYVIKYPADIWYGQQAQYLRVLEHKDDRKCLYLQSIGSMSQALDVINKIYRAFESYDQYDLAKKWILKNYSEKQSLNAKIVFICIQNYFVKEGKEVIAKQRKPIEQTQLLLKMGYTSVRDSATSHKKAAINDREPEQILFLRRDTFNVVETFIIGKGGKGITSQSDDKDLREKFAAKLFTALGDKLKSYDTDSGYYWSKNGLRATITTESTPNSHEGLKIGQKKHRASTTTNLKILRVKLEGDHGVLNDSIYDETFDDSISYIAKTYLSRPIVEWEPDSKEKEQQRQKEAKEKYYEELRSKDIESALSFAKEIAKHYNLIAKHYKRPSIDFETDTYNKISSLTAQYKSCYQDYRNWESNHVTGGDKKIEEFLSINERSHLKKFFKGVEYDIETYRFLEKVIKNTCDKKFGTLHGSYNNEHSYYFVSDYLKRICDGLGL